MRGSLGLVIRRKAAAITVCLVPFPFPQDKLPPADVKVGIMFGREVRWA